MPTRKQPLEERAKRKKGRWKAWTSSLKTTVPRIQSPEPPRIGRVSVESLEANSVIGALQPDERPRNSGLFEGLLGSDPRHLLYDIVDDAQKYNSIEDHDRLVDVLRELTSGAVAPNDLTPEDRALLEEATLEFATAPASKQLEEGRKQLEMAVQKAVDQVLAPRPVPAKEDIPDTEMPPFWWL